MPPCAILPRRPAVKSPQGPGSPTGRGSSWPAHTLGAPSPARVRELCAARTPGPTAGPRPLLAGLDHSRLPLSPSNPPPHVTVQNPPSCELCAAQPQVTPQQTPGPRHPLGTERSAPESAGAPGKWQRRSGPEGHSHLHHGWSPDPDRQPRSRPSRMLPPPASVFCPPLHPEAGGTACPSPRRPSSGGRVVTGNCPHSGCTAPVSADGCGKQPGPHAPNFSGTRPGLAPRGRH